MCEALLAQEDLKGYYLLYAAQADFCRQLGRSAEAAAAYQQALALTEQDAERLFLTSQLNNLQLS